MSCTPKITPDRTAPEVTELPFKPLPTGKTFTVDEVRQIPEPYTTMEVLVAAHGFAGIAKYTFDTSSTVADDGAAVLRPTWRTADEAGRWLREDLGGIGAHVGAPNPHPQYQLTAEKGVAGGYASLDVGGKVPDSEIPAMIARDSEVAAAVTAHEAAADPHTGYIKEDGTRPFSGDQSLGGNRLTNVDDPGAAQDAATKNYVDLLIAGFDFKGSVRLATAAPLPSNTYNGGTLQLTATANGALSVDGSPVGAGQRILVKDEVTATNNGLYEVIDPGDGSNPYILERTSDADSSADITAGMLVVVEEGAVNADKFFILTTNNPITLDATALTFAAFQSVTDHGALTGLGDDDHPQYILTTGLREQDEQTAWPTTPAADKWIEQFMPRGRYIIDDVGRVIGPLGDGPRHHRSVMVWQKVAGKQARTRIGHDTDITATGTEAENLDSDGQFLRYTSAAAINADAGWQQATFNYVARQNRPVIDFVIKTGDRITDIRIWNAYTSADLMASGVPGTVHLMGVRFDSALDGGVGNWFFVTGDGSGTSQNSDTGVPIAPDTKYHFRLECLDSGEVVLYCDDIPVAVHGAGDFLPGLTQMLGLQSESRTLDVVPAIDDVYHKIQRISVEYDG